MHLLESVSKVAIILKIISIVNSETIDFEKLQNVDEYEMSIALPKPMTIFERKEKSTIDVMKTRTDSRSSKTPTMMDIALQKSAKQGLDAMNEFYNTIEPELLRKGQILEHNHPAALLSKFSAPTEEAENNERAAFATLSAAKAFSKNYKEFNYLGRQAHAHKISLRRTALESLCPPRDPPVCLPATQRYRTHDGTCNNLRRPRWGSAQMPFSRFLPPEYGDGIDTIRFSTDNTPLASARVVSLMVHGARDGDASITLMMAQWGQLLDHDLTSTAQPRSMNGSVPKCCGNKDFHPSCFPIKVPLDDPWLAPLKIKCLEFLRSAPAHRRDCILSWREQTNQVTSYIDASPIYSSRSKLSENVRQFRNGLLIFGRDSFVSDECQRGALAHHCIRSADARSGEQPGLLALHHVWVGEHNRIAMELSNLNPHWSDEKLYQETRRIIGALFQHITYREFLPIVLGREVCRLFDLDLQNSGYYHGYDVTINPTIANSFSSAAFRFGHSLVQGSYMRCDSQFNVINSSVSLHEEFQNGDVGTPGSLHRLLRGLATQRAMRRDEFITPELTNHLFQTRGFPFGLDLAAINIQRGRDHGIAPYTSWREPCGLSAVNTWEHFANVVGPESAKRISNAYRSVHDIDLFVGGIAERPVIGGLVGPTFACIIAQQFSNLRKGDRFWYENSGFESSFSPAQLRSLRRVSLAQILCRAVGQGTFQPHIFIPSEFTGNQRLPCGVGLLEPIDLSPWSEGISVFTSSQPPIPQSTTSDKTLDMIRPHVEAFSIVKKSDVNTQLLHLTPNVTKVTVIELIPNASLELHRPLNVTKIDDKLDFQQKSTTVSSTSMTGISNKIDLAGHKTPTRTKMTTNIRRRIVTTTTPPRRASIVLIKLRNNVDQEPQNSKKLIKTETNETIRKTQTSTDNDYDPIQREFRTEEHYSNNEFKLISNEIDRDSNTESSNAEYLQTNQDERLLTEVSPTKTVEYSDNVMVISCDSERNHLVSPDRGMDILTTQTQNLFRPTVVENLTTPSDEGLAIMHEPSLEYGTTDASKENFHYKDMKMKTILRTHQDLYDSSKSCLTEQTKPRNKTFTFENDLYRPDKYSKTNSSPIGIKLNITVLDRNDTSDDSPIIRIHLTNTNTNKTKTKTLAQGKTKDLRQQLDTMTEDKQTDDIDPLFRAPPEPKYHIRVTRSIDSNIETTTKNINITFTDNLKTLISNSKNRKNKTTTKSPQSKLQQVQLRRNYHRPDKIIFDPPNSDEYEIEINIRQKGQTKPGAYDRYDPSHETRTQPPGYDYLGQLMTTQFPTYFAQSQRTKPPTIIYLNEHDHYHTTVRPSGLLQNFLSFASSGFGNHKGSHNASPNRIVNSQFPPGSSNPHSPALSAYRPLVGGGELVAGTASIANAGSSHASSSAVSTGQFGVIMGTANAHGSDSTFSFNIRPRPISNGGSSSYDHPSAISHEHYPTGNSHYHHRPNRPDSYNPFSSSSSSTLNHNGPSLDNYYSRTSLDTNLPLQKDTNNDNHFHIQTKNKLDKPNYDLLGKTFNNRPHIREVNEIEHTSNNTKIEKLNTTDHLQPQLILNSHSEQNSNFTQPINESTNEEQRQNVSSLMTTQSFTKLTQFLAAPKTTKARLRI